MLQPRPGNGEEREHQHSRLNPKAFTAPKPRRYLFSATKMEVELRPNGIHPNTRAMRHPRRQAACAPSAGPPASRPFK